MNLTTIKILRLSAEYPPWCVSDGPVIRVKSHGYKSLRVLANATKS